MSADANALADCTPDTDDLETWMQFIDWETLDWIPDAPASAAQAGSNGQLSLPMHMHPTLEHTPSRQLVDRAAVTDRPVFSRSTRLQGHNEWHPASMTTEVVNGDENDQRAADAASQQNSAETSEGVGLLCNHSGCNCGIVFSRQWELQRHIASKHTSEKPFWCPVVGCIKGRSAPAFARPDKLTQHIRAVHHRGGSRAVCPSGGCTDMPLELDVLGVHIKLQHLTGRHKLEGVSGQFLRAMINAASTDRRNCPLWFCRKRVELDDFPAHLLTHTNEELGASANELTHEGYTMSKLGCDHGEDILDCPCAVTAIKLLCPVCASSQWDRQSLKTHIEEVHVWSGEDVSTFRQRILALIGMEAAQFLDGRVWSDVACPLRLNTQN